jgi:hypothetical protein
MEERSAGRKAMPTRKLKSEQSRQHCAIVGLRVVRRQEPWWHALRNRPSLVDEISDFTQEPGKREINSDDAQ